MKPPHSQIMITTADFKKQIGKTFGQEMRAFGFKGTGFEYFQETEEFLIAVYIDSGRWGKKCTAGFAIHPKVIDKNSEGMLNLQKLKSYQYEFKMPLTSYARGESWNYSDNETENIQIVNKIVTSIKKKAFPVIKKFTDTPNFLDLYDIRDLEDFYNKWTKKTGVFISSSELVFAWVMTKYLEKKNIQKAKQFAEWGLSQPKINDKIWFGQVDFERVASHNGA